MLAFRRGNPPALAVGGAPCFALGAPALQRPQARAFGAAYTVLMTDTFSTRTVCCKLRVDSAADTVLRETQAAFNAAASYCATVAWEQGITNKNTLHHSVSGATRAQF